MNFLLRVGPYLYAALHSYNSVWELLLTKRERRRAERDAERLAAHLPFLVDYPRAAEPFRAKFSADYRAYTSSVSPDPIAISFELAVFLAALCDAQRPSAILDLGSGFSSYVFRMYAKDANTHPEPPVRRPSPAAHKTVVYSVDHSPDWLTKTRRFLEARSLDCSNLLAWNDFVAADKPPFDLALLDIADLDTRLGMIDLLVDCCHPGGMIVVDDMHVPGYRRSVLRKLEKRHLESFSLRSFTRKKLRHSYLILR